MNRLSFANKRIRLAVTPALVAMAALALFFASSGRINSQWPATGAKPPQAVLAEMKTANEDLLKKQEATLERFDALQKEADQLRIFTSQH